MTTPHDFQPDSGHDVRFVNCQVCQTEGRLLTNNGGPCDVDHGVCPACDGERVVEVETEPVELEDIETIPVSRPDEDNSPRCNHWPGQHRCGVCGMDEPPYTRPECGGGNG